MGERPAIPSAAERVQRTCALSDSVSSLRYVKGARQEALARLGIRRVRDLLLHVPHRYLDFTNVTKIARADVGRDATVVATVDRVDQRRARTRPNMKIVELSVVDETGVLIATFFRQPWVAEQVHEGDTVALSGKVTFGNGFRQMKAPFYEVVTGEGGAGGYARVLPVHPVTEGLTASWMRRIVASALERVSEVCDPLPARLRAQRGLMSRGRALRSIHFPRQMADVRLARRRLSYEEVLLLQLALRLRNDVDLLGVRAVAHTPARHVEALRRALPFSLSDEQEACVGEILADMSDPGHVMNRLLLGDVGTGKTAVAAMALACVADTGTQACVMAPTSVLAQQYAVKTGPLLEQAGVSWALLTGATPQAERARLLENLANGSLDVLFGTHAVLSDDVVFKSLSLVVIDEQHRFGVHQRNELRSKGEGADLLVMTATPIPRTLALTVYGDLDTSVIRKRPVPGAGVATKVLTEANRDLAYEAVGKALAEGHQAYVVCPLVAPSDSTDELDDVPAARADEGGRAPVRLHSVEEELARLSREVFPQSRVEALHGRMSAAEKERVIDAFRAGEIDILVSTTVVEVGVDVPNATVMVIENGERFGLATLHQLRGRVGRGKHAGSCYIMTYAKHSGKTSAAHERLEALEKSSDGFELAEIDLRLRHEGEILGFRQHGGVSLRFVDLEDDAQLIAVARDDARTMLRYSRDLSAPALVPVRQEIVRRYGDVFKEVSGG